MKSLMTYITPKRAIIIVVIILIGGGLLSFLTNKNEETIAEESRTKIVRIETIEKQDTVSSDLHVSGTVVPREYSVIRSLTPGTIEFIVPVGVEVVRGQSLFSIRDANVENAYFNALEDLNSTNAATEQQIVQAELALNSKKAALVFSQKNLQTTKDRAAQNILTAQNSAIVAYRSAYNSLTQVLSNLGTGSISDKSTYLYSNVLTSESQVRSEARAQYDVVAAQYRELSSTVTPETLTMSLFSIQNVLIEAKNLIDATVIILQNSVDPQYATDLAKQQANQTTINSLNASIITNSDAINTTRINSDFSIQQDENRLELAQIEYNNAVVALDSAVANSRIQNSSVKSRFDAAAYNFSNLTLPSPFTGTILSHAVNAGEQVSAGQEIVEIGNLNIIEVDVDVDASFADGLKVNDNVVINGSIPGFIAELEPVGSIASGKVGVKVQSDDNTLVTGDIADVLFDLIYETPDSIVIPIKAATIEEVRTTVFIEVDGAAVLRTVTLGKIIGDKVTVTSGLSEGDRLIIPDGTFISEGDNVQSRAE